MIIPHADAAVMCTVQIPEDSSCVTLALDSRSNAPHSCLVTPTVFCAVLVWCGWCGSGVGGVGGLVGVGGVVLVWSWLCLTLSWAGTHYCSTVAIKNLTIIFLESTTHCSEESHRNNCLEMMLI